MNKTILLDLHFQVTALIRSFPFWHGARWNALLRIAARMADTEADEAYVGIVPERKGTEHWHADDIVRLRLMIHPKHLAATGMLLRSLTENNTGEGEFRLGRTLAFLHAGIPGDHVPISFVNYDRLLLDTALSPGSLCPAAVKDEAEALGRLDKWSIHILSPLRLTRPAGDKHHSRYADTAFFCNDQTALSCFLSRIRFPLMDSHRADELEISHCDLQWHDLAYNRDRQIKLGGVTGSIVVKGRPDSATALTLAGGQYTGVGKNARFGLGMYCIPELENYRRIEIFPK